MAARAAGARLRCGTAVQQYGSAHGIFVRRLAAGRTTAVGAAWAFACMALHGRMGAQTQAQTGHATGGNDTPVLRFHVPCNGMWDGTSMGCTQSIPSCRLPRNHMCVPPSLPDSSSSSAGEEVSSGGRLMLRGLRLKVGLEWGPAAARLVPHTGRLDYTGTCAVCRRACRETHIFTYVVWWSYAGKRIYFQIYTLRYDV